MAISVALDDQGEIVPGRGTTYTVFAAFDSLAGLSPASSNASSLSRSSLPGLPRVATR